MRSSRGKLLLVARSPHAAAVVALPVALATLIIFVACSGGSTVPQDADGHLAAAFGSRPLVARLAGFPHQRCPESRVRTRIDLGRCQPLPAPDDERFELLAEVGLRGDRSNVPEARRARALWSLLWTDGGESLDRSIAELAVLTASGDPSSASDLAAALLLRASVRDDPADLILALDVCDRTIAAGARASALLFNRALALEALALDGEAVKAWKGYLGAAADDHAGWRTEALDHLRGLQRHPTRPSREPDSGSRSLRTLLERWAAAQLARDVAATEEALGQLRRLTLRGETSQELMAARALAAVEGAAQRDRSDDLARAHELFAAALEDYHAMRLDAAEDRFDATVRGFRLHASPFAGEAQLHLAIVRFQRGEPQRAAAALETLLGDDGGEQLPTELATRALWMLGLIEQKNGRPTAAVGRYREALGHVDGRDPRLEDGLRVLLAEALDDLGDHTGAWRHRHAALLARRERSEPRTLHNLLYEITRILRRGDATAVAFYFHDEMVDNCERLPEPACAEALLFRARTSLQMKDPTQARADLDRALERLAAMPDGEIRMRTEGEVQLSRSSLLAASDPAAAAAALADAEERLRRFGEAQILPVLLAERADLRLRLGDLEAAESDLAAAASEVEQLLDGELGEDRLGRFRSIFERMADFQIERRRDDRAALAWIERLAAVEWAAEASSSEALLAVPAGDVLLRFALVEDHVHVWILAAERFERRELKASPTQLGDMLDLLADAVTAGDRRVQREVLQRLHDTLLPAEALSEAADGHLVVVPDRLLHRVPWAALLDTDGRFLIESVTPVVAPSASWYLASRAAVGNRRVDRSARVLIIGDAEISGSFAHLPPLPAVREEISAMERLYPDPEGVVVRGAEATPERFLRELRTADVLHFAGHAIGEGGGLDDAAFVLAPSPERSAGLLAARELSGGPPLRLRLAVLGSCVLGGGSDDFFPPMAKALLLRGVPTVVAATHDLDDDLARQLFPRIHQLLREGEGPAEALRRAQLDLLHMAPGQWGSVRVLGAP